MQDLDPQVDWSLVWSRVATTLGGHLAAGRGHLVSRDTVRLATILALQGAGVAPSRMTLDLLGQDGKETSTTVSDLLVDGRRGTVVSLGLPPSETGGTRDTQLLGVLVRDLLRIADVPARHRWVVQVLESEPVRHLSSMSGRLRLSWPSRAGARALINQEALDDLPVGASRMLDGMRWPVPVVAACEGVWPVSAELDLYAYDVSTPTSAEEASESDDADATQAAAPAAQAAGGGPAPAPARAQAQAPAPSRVPAAPSGAAEQVLQQPPAVTAPSPDGTARAEVLHAVRAVVVRTGSDVVRIQDVLEQVRSANSRFGEATVVTMMTKHMCAQAQGRGIASYDDLDQVDDGWYRLRPGR